jgi:alanyl-tRNA synthetase
MTANEIRQRFIDFYLAKDHRFVQSAPLVPHDDPTLLFTSAGMVQFKQYYAGAVPLPFRRAVSVQKCLRVNDIEDVGHTPRHDTFFEMLGHFSFGDYFKREAILWNWELFTRVLGLDPARLSASVFEQDDEAYAIWRDEIGLPPERIVRLGAKDNFWGPAGETGACGPCSELYIDLGPEVDPEQPNARPGDDTNRFVEVGNFVFPQFDRQKDGSDRPLANRGIDTGIGLERLAMAVQGKTTIFHTDLFMPIIEEAARLCAVPYVGHESALHIISDHARALTFAVSEGVLPSNEGRGYVIRRLIRRAAVQAYDLGLREPMLHRLVDTVVAMMGTTYPEVAEGRERTVLALRNEEERFGETLAQALGRLEAVLADVRGQGLDRVPGGEAFLLYDTYGLPFELVEDLASSHGLGVDRAGFERCLTEQKERSRAAASFTAVADALDWQSVSSGGPVEFVGYDETAAHARVLRYANDGEAPERAWVVLNRTPFYGASGGQVGDTGTLTSGSVTLRVLDAQRADTEVRHLVAIDAQGRAALARPEREWQAEIDRERRDHIRRHHTATHLLQAALRRVLGKHVAQAGSLVGPDRLRFDFTHFAALTPTERDTVEQIANAAIVADIPVEIEYSTHAEAVRDGVTALFGEKYDLGRVRRVRVAGVSEELCGGTHVSATGEIGSLLILEEVAVAAGTRRIEAVCGLAALAAVQKLRQDVGQLRRLLGTTLEGAPGKVEQLLAEGARLRKELARVRRGEGATQLDTLLDQAQSVGARRYLVGEVAAESAAPASRERRRAARREGRREDDAARDRNRRRCAGRCATGRPLAAAGGRRGGRKRRRQAAHGARRRARREQAHGGAGRGAAGAPRGARAHIAQWENDEDPGHRSGGAVG